jgi:hypothetical protein
MNNNKIQGFLLIIVIVTCSLSSIYSLYCYRVQFRHRTAFQFPLDIPSTGMEQLLYYRTQDAKRRVVRYISQTSPLDVNRQHSQAIRILPCFDKLTFYYKKRLNVNKILRKGSNWMLAFVNHNYNCNNCNSIFINASWFLVPKKKQVQTIIHECAHIRIGAKDYAYEWQSAFYELSPLQHEINADSLALEMVDFDLDFEFDDYIYFDEEMDDSPYHYSFL